MFSRLRGDSNLLILSERDVDVFFRVRQDIEPKQYLVCLIKIFRAYDFLFCEFECVCVCVCQRERGCVPVRIFPTSPIFFFSYLDKSPCLPPPHSNRTFRDTILPHLHRNSCSSKDSRRGFLSLLPQSFGYTVST